MEKIITVKREPVDEHYVATTASTTTGSIPVLVTSSPATVTPITVQVSKPESQPRQACAVLPKTQAPGQVASPNKPFQVVSSMGHSTPPMVVLSGSPIKLTQVRGPVKNAAGTSQMPVGKAVQQMSNVTFVQVQPFSPGAKKGSPMKQGMPIVQKVIPISMATTTMAQALSSGLVTTGMSSSGVVTVRAIAPKMSIAHAPSVAQAIQLAPKPSLGQVAGNTSQGQNRILIPASALVSNANSHTLQFPHGVISGGVVYLPQQALQSGGFPIAVPLTANAFTPNNQGNLSVNGRTSPEASPPNNRPRKPCNCTKSQCLKLYCDCFAQGEFCSNCNCINCSNNMDHERERSKAIKACLERNPHAFHPKIGKGKVGESERRHNKGCHCKRSGCLKNYCECYEAKILCTSLCKCTGCKNFEESPERKTLMHLADAAEVRVNQQNAAKTKLESQIEDLPTRPPIMSSSGERLPFSFVTEDVVQATCQCVIAQAVEAEKLGLSPAMAEKMILEEFGRSLLQIIHTASKTKNEQ